MIAMFWGTNTMRPMAKWLLVCLLVASGSACTTVLAPERTQALGPPFNEALKDGYLQLADSRWQEGSWEVLRFRDKARQAMLGDAVWPDDAASARMPASLQSELVEERERLLLVLNSGGRVLAPEDAALAQVSFDCWLSEAKETKQPGSGCQDTFRTALGKTELAVTATLPEPYVVMFESGSDRAGWRGPERRDRGVARGPAPGARADQRDRLRRSVGIDDPQRGAVAPACRECRGGAAAGRRIAGADRGSGRAAHALRRRTGDASRSPSTASRGRGAAAAGCAPPGFQLS